jgi:hypothetical protein
MTNLLKQVIAEVEKLPDEEQDRIAEELIGYLSANGLDHDPQLSDEQLAELRRRRSNPNARTLTLEELEPRLSFRGA